MSLQLDIREAMKKAMVSRDLTRLNTLRGLLSAFTNEAISKGRRPDQELSDDEALTVISRGVKQRKDSIEQFERAGRNELAILEKEELAILETYLPEQMTREEIEKVVSAKSAQLDIVNKDKAGQLIGAVMRELEGRADGALVKEIVDSLLN
jgi:uncharacterized protein